MTAIYTLLTAKSGWFESINAMSSAPFFSA
jgi:hypothetical protein